MSAATDRAFKLAIIKALQGVIAILVGRVGASAEVMVRVAPHIDAAVKALEQESGL